VASTIQFAHASAVSTIDKLGVGEAGGA